MSQGKKLQLQRIQAGNKHYLPFVGRNDWRQRRPQTITTIGQVWEKKPYKSVIGADLYGEATETPIAPLFGKLEVAGSNRTEAKQ